MAIVGVVGPGLAPGQSQMPAGVRWSSRMVCLLLISCGGGAPLLHPAHSLPVNTVSFGAGVSGQFASGGARGTIDRGRSAATQPLSDPTIARRYAEGVLTHALVAPGLSPWVSARVGLPYATEGGLTYTGRSIRLDGRLALPLGERWALSAGLGATALLLSPDSSRPTPDASAEGADAAAEFELEARGWGADIPIVIGYEAIDGFVDIWVGARAGFERLTGELSSREGAPAAPSMDAEGSRWWVAGLGGFSLGVPPLWLRFELSTTFHQLSGTLRGAELETGGGAAAGLGSLNATGWTLSPSGAIVGKF